jgi:HAD superfamily hydrolase (TIGR01509 family)
MEADLKPVEGIEAALDQITIPYCIASNGPHSKMRKTLGITSLLPRFEGRLFSSDDVPRGKPFPDLFLLAARHFAVMASACLVIEDSASGVAAAVAAGMSVYGFSGNATDERLLAAGANRIFHQMSELPSLLTGLPGDADR